MLVLKKDFGFGRFFSDEKSLMDDVLSHREEMSEEKFKELWTAAQEAVRASKNPQALERFVADSDSLKVDP